jgi:hypothetical protein
VECRRDLGRNNIDLVDCYGKWRETSKTFRGEPLYPVNCESTRRQNRLHRDVHGSWMIADTDWGSSLEAWATIESPSSVVSSWRIDEAFVPCRSNPSIYSLVRLRRIIHHQPSHGENNPAAPRHAMSAAVWVLLSLPCAYRVLIFVTGGFGHETKT